MEYLLDTDHLSCVQERHPAVTDRLAAFPPDARVLTSVVSVAELLRGVCLLPESRRQRELLELYRRVKARPIPVNDVWVAAAAKARGAALVTNDERFTDVDGLVVENRTQ